MKSKGEPPLHHGMKKKNFEMLRKNQKNVQIYSDIKPKLEFWGKKANQPHTLWLIEFYKVKKVFAAIWRRK